MKTQSILKNQDSIFQNRLYLTDGGLETTLVFHKGIELNFFSSFELLNDEWGRHLLTECYRPYLDLAVNYNYSFVFETPTWRANPDWGYRLGYSAEELNALNRNAKKWARSVIREHRIDQGQVIVSGNIGLRGDGYRVDATMTSTEAKTYHTEQIKSFVMADADMVSAFTLNYTDEAIGIVLAAEEFHIPVVISFTVETDGNLPNGETLKEAIEKTDQVTNGYAVFYMINCAHPEHFIHLFKEKENWMNRIGAIHANASTKSHAELDESETLDPGDKHQLAEGYRELYTLLPNIQVIGGCCGTDYSHLEEIGKVIPEGRIKRKTERSI